MNIMSSPLSSTSSVNDKEPRESQGKTNPGDMEAPEYDTSRVLSQEAQSFGHENIELQRTSSSRLQQDNTVGSAHNRPSRESWLSHGAGIPYPPSTDTEKLIVEFDGAEDPMHPKNWGMRKRCVADCTIPTSRLGFVVLTCCMQNSLGHSLDPLRLCCSVHKRGFPCHCHWS